MSGWQTTKLGDVITDIAAGPFGSNLKVSCFVPDGFPIIDGANLKGTWLTDNITKFVTEEKARSLRRSIAKRNDVVVTISGTLGQIAFIPEHSKYEEYLCSQRQFRATFDSSRVDVAFLVYYFHTHEGQSKILAFANQVGVPALSQPLKNFREIQVSLPPLAEQRRIAGVLRTYDEAIENCRRQISLLEEAAQRIYREWFKDGKGQKKKMWDVCDFFRGVSYTSEEIADPNGKPLITLKNIDRFGGFREDRTKFFTGNYNPSSLASGGDVLMAVTDMTKERRLVGHVALVPDTYKSSPFSMDLVKLEAKGFSTLFLYALFRYTDYSEQFAVRASGANVLHLKPSSLSDIEIVVPDQEKQSRFVSVFAPMVEQKNKLMRQARLFAEARDRLLPRLLNGETSA